MIDELNCKADEAIVLLSRNNMPDFICHDCEAAYSVFSSQEDGRIRCKSCFEKKKDEDPDFDDEMVLPVVNSPRMGVCAYEGGMIDLEGDRHQGAEYVEF